MHKHKKDYYGRPLPARGAGAYPGARNKLYRSRHGRIFGVCRGIAEHMDAPVGVIRVLTVLGAIFTGFWLVVGAYLILALVLKPEPVLPIESEADAEFYNSYAVSPDMAVQRLKRIYDGLDRRIQRMEGIVTARDYDWERRLDESK